MRAPRQSQKYSQGLDLASSRHDVMQSRAAHSAQQRSFPKQGHNRDQNMLRVPATRKELDQLELLEAK